MFLGFIPSLFPMFSHGTYHAVLHDWRLEGRSVQTTGRMQSAPPIHDIRTVMKSLQRQTSLPAQTGVTGITQDVLM